MTAETLRKAAAAMRERAEAAAPGPWHVVAVHGLNREDYPDDQLVSRSPEYDWDALVTPAAGEFGDDGLRSADAEHIASWHPAVALAVADWLEHESYQPETEHEGGAYTTGGPSLQARQVALIYLGEIP